MFNIRLVTANPPTTLIVAKMSAKNASHAAAPGFPQLKSVFEKIKAPTIVIPEIALAPDINGV